MSAAFDQSLIDSMQAELISRLSSIEVAEHSVEPGVDSGPFMSRQLVSGIISKFAAFLAANADMMPEKKTVLLMLERAIDAAFTAIGRPILASILKPIVKAQILALASDLYDSVFNPPTTEPRIEV